MSSKKDKCKCGKDIEHPRVHLCSCCYKEKRRVDWYINHKRRVKDDSDYLIKRKRIGSLAVKRWQNKNRERIYARQVERCRNEPEFLLKRIIRKRISEAVKNRCKNTSAVDSLGCSIEELRIYLESQFQEGMSWDNYGEWHIDHIRPLASFSLSNSEELKKACHYTNLQPLWAKDNLRKGANE